MTRARTRGAPPVSRADLLQALALAGEDTAQAQRWAGLLDFRHDPPQPELPAQRLAAGPRSRALDTAPDSPVPPRPAEAAPMSVPQVRLPVVTAREDFKVPEKADGLEAPAEIADAPEAGPWRPGHVAPRPPLLRPTQLWPALAGALRDPRDAGLDIPALLRQLSQGRSLRRLPRARRPVWGGQLWVVIDRAPHLQPYAEDLLDVLRQLVRLRGREGLVVWVVDGSPDQALDRPVTLDGRAVPQSGRWPRPPAGSSVVLLSDLGGALSRPPSHWLPFITYLVDCGAQPSAWLPVSPAQVPQALADVLPVHCLQAGTPLRRQKARGHGEVQQRTEAGRLQALLPTLRAMVACCVRLDEPLLRALRLVHPALRHEPALEALYWADAGHVSSSLASRTLRPAAARPAREYLAEGTTEIWPDDLRGAIARELLAHHAGRPRSTLMVELSLWRTHAGAADGDAWAVGADTELAEALDAADAWLRQLGRHAEQLPDLSAVPAQQVAAYARDLLTRQSDDAAWMARMGEPLARLWAVTGQQDPVPVHLPERAMLQALNARPTPPKRGWRLVQRGEMLWLWPETEPLPARSSWVCGVFRTANLVLSGADDARSVVSPGDSAEPLMSLRQVRLPVRLTFDEGCLTLDAISRPAWAREWGRDSEGLKATLDLPWPAAERMRWVDGGSLAGRPWWRAERPRLRPRRTIFISWGDVPDAWRKGLQNTVRFHCMQASQNVEFVDELPSWAPAPGSNIAAEFSDYRAAWLQSLRDCPAGEAICVFVLTHSRLKSQFLMQTDEELLNSSELRDAVRQGMQVVLIAATEGLRERIPEPWVSFSKTAPLSAHGSTQGLRLADVEETSQLLLDVILAAPMAPDEHSGPTWSSGVDGDYGAFLDFSLGQVTQRFRYMPPGEFWMGSPDDEPEREEAEGPRHRVRLTEGYWLADTACTQALWFAVMGGKNPSHFQHDLARPVEKVSWDDVQTFLQRLQPLLPAGCEAVLPTEAQWEYACRAGTQTPFSFGPDVTPEEVNYEGSFPYAAGRKGEWRGKTVPVRSLPANGWGLYEMHGNVWEWCSDGVLKGDDLRRYPAQQDGDVLENPSQPQGSGPAAQRVLRGGSWFLCAGACRSAYRRSYGRGKRISEVGFRFALRSSSPVMTVTRDASRQDPEGPGGSRAPAAERPASVPFSSGRDGPAAPSKRPPRSRT
ncbi:formylglycine-generating enzyme family protein [Pseudaquabacterium rugosum]|uniref:Formylglycine-generating enzyme family protein n=1 Tax=Pseudaquabacterium rugosum TaxID=2984194 RepID=A0ABU9BAW8_9BURK